MLVTNKYFIHMNGIEGARMKDNPFMPEKWLVISRAIFL